MSETQYGIEDTSEPTAVKKLRKKIGGTIQTISERATAL
jgi:hypothetical protein